MNSEELRVSIELEFVTLKKENKKGKDRMHDNVGPIRKYWLSQGKRIIDRLGAASKALHAISKFFSKEFQGGFVCLTVRQTMVSEFVIFGCLFHYWKEIVTSK